MQIYYIVLPIVILLVFLFMMWRDIRTLKSRVTEVVEQHNNVKKVLDKHESMIVMGDPMRDFKFETIEGNIVPPPEQQSTPEIKEEEQVDDTHKKKKSKST